jgi:hypothetical protein
MNIEPPFPWMKDKPDTFRYHLENDTGSFLEYTRTKRLALGESLLKVRRVYLDTKRITTEFPTVGIPAALHAAVRLDKNRKYKKGDFEDFHHAALAVGYFDVFLTESSLQHLLRSNYLDVEQVYGCTVLSGEQDVLEHLRILN